MRAFITVRLKEKEYPFVFIIHQTKDGNERLIDDTFYQTQTLQQKVPEGIHHEMEIISPLDLVQDKHAEKLDLHVSTKNQRLFVKWCGPLRLKKLVEVIAATWCQATVYTMDTGMSLKSLCDKHFYEGENEALEESVQMKEMVRMSAVLENEYKVALTIRIFDPNN